jgi:hypothetical protein
MFCQSEIGECDSIGAPHEHVSGLQVPMQRSGFMQGGQRTGYLCREVEGVSRRNARTDAPAQIASGYNYFRP